MDIGVIAVVFLLGTFFLAISAGSQYAAPAETNKDLLDTLKSIIHQVSIEKYDNIEYWFDKNTSCFLGQGKTFDDVIAVLKIRFPDHAFVLEDIGGISAKTEWQLKTFDELRNIPLVDLPLKR